MDTRERHEQIDYSHVGHHWLMGAGVLLAGIAVLIYVIWLMVATPQATPFDADGVRCYRAASELACIKTAEPAR